MSTPMGFRFLYAADYIDREMELWFHVGSVLFTSRTRLIKTGQERNLQYVVHMEVFLAKAFNPGSMDDDDNALFAVPSFFYSHC